MTTYVLDTYTGADGLIVGQFFGVSGHQADTGGAFEVAQGSGHLVLHSNHCKHEGATSSQTRFIEFNTGAAGNIYAEFDLYAVGSADGESIAMRDYGIGDSIRVRYYAGALRLEKAVGGSVNTSYGTYTIDLSVPRKIGLLFTKSTNSFSVYLNRSEVIAPAAVGAFQSERDGYVNIGSANPTSDGTTEWDNFLVTDAVPGLVADHLAFTTQPIGAGTSGSTLATQPVVAAKKSDASTDTSYAGTVVISLTGTGTLTGTTSKALVAGVATFTDLVITGTGTSQLVATLSPLTAATSSTVTTGSGGSTGGLTAGDSTMIAALGGTTKIVQWNDARQNVTVVGTLVDKVSDYRGSSGFGLDLIGYVASGSKPVYDVDAKTITLNVTGSQNALLSATDTRFDPTTTARTIYVGISMEANQGYVAGLQSVDATKVAMLYSGIDSITGTSLVRADQPTPGNRLRFPCTQSGTPQLLRQSYPGNAGYPNNNFELQANGRVVAFQGSPTFTATGWRAAVGGTPGAASPTFSHAVFKFFLVVDHVTTSTEDDAVKLWALTQHGIVADAVRNTIVWPGNSLSAGFANSAGNDLITQTMNGFPGWGEIGYFAVSGESGDAIAANLEVRELPSYHASHPRNVAVLAGELTNEVRNGDSAATIQARIIADAASLRTRGYKTMFCTMPKWSTLQNESVRAAVCTYFRTNWATYFDALADLALIPEMSDPNNTTYFADGVHPTDAGVLAMATNATYGTRVNLAPLMVATGTIVSDAFTGTDGTLLTAHTPTLGLAWEQVAGPAASLKIQVNALWVATSSYAYSVYRLTRSGGYGTVNYNAAGNVNFQGNTAATMLYAARITGNGYECYAGGWERGTNADTGYRIVKFDAAGNLSVLANFYSPSFPTITPTLVELIPYGTGASVKLFLRVNGSIVASAVDSFAPYITGTAGVAVYSQDAAPPPFGVYLDDFRVDPVPSGAFLATITTQPTGGVSGVVLPTQGVITVQDITGATVTTDSRVFTVSLEFLTVINGVPVWIASSAITGGTLSEAAVNGVADFAGNGITVTGSGTFRLVYDGGTVGKAYSNSFIVTPTATRLTIVQPGSGFSSGSACTTPFIVKATDASGAVDTTWQGRIIATASAGASTAGPNEVVVGSYWGHPGGTATFRRLKLVGSGITSAITFTAVAAAGFAALSPATSGGILIGGPVGTFATRSAGGATNIELPRFVPPYAYPTIDGTTQTIAATSSALQAAINTVAAYTSSGVGTANGTKNHEIKIPDSSTATYNVVLPPRPADCTGEIIIRCAQALPTLVSAMNGGLQAADMGTRAILETTTNQIFDSSDVTAGKVAHHYRIAGLTLRQNAANTFCYQLVVFGTSYPTSSSDCAHHMLLDRCRLTGDPSQELRQALYNNANWSGMVHCTVDEVHQYANESHGVIQYTCEGPFIYHDNWMRVAGIHIISGGNDSNYAECVPSDGTITCNWLTRNPAWQGVWEVKNNIDLKNSQRTLVQGNVLENVWDDQNAGTRNGQAGSLTNYKSVNQSNTAPWSGTTDLTVRGNLYRNAREAIATAGNPEGKPDVLFADALFSDNIAVNIEGADFFRASDYTEGVIVEHCTLLASANAGTILVACNLGRLPNYNTRLQFVNNVMASVGFSGGIVMDDHVGGESFALGAPGGVLSYNVFANPAGGYGMSDAAYAAAGGVADYMDGVTLAAIGFVNAGISSTMSTAAPLTIAAALTLSGTSPYRAAGTRPASDGADRGANMVTVAAMLSGTYTSGGPATAVASALTVLTQPVGATVGTPLATQPVFRELDQFGSTVGASGTVTVVRNIVSGGVGSVLGGTTTKTFSGSDATFTNLSLSVPGVYTLTASDQYGHAVTTAQFTVTAGVAQVTAVGLVVDVSPTTAVRHVAFSPQPSGRVLDANGAVVTTFNGRIQAYVLAGRGRLKTDGSIVSAVNGVWAFTTLTPDSNTPIALGFLTHDA